MNRLDINFLLNIIEVQEFYRLRSSLRAKKEHASLLDDFREFDRTRLDLEEGGGSPQQALLREHASISRSTGQVCEGILVLDYFLLVTCLFCFSIVCVTYQTKCNYYLILILAA